MEVGGDRGAQGSIDAEFCACAGGIHVNLQLVGRGGGDGDAGIDGGFDVVGPTDSLPTSAINRMRVAEKDAINAFGGHGVDEP